MKHFRWIATNLIFLVILLYSFHNPGVISFLVKTGIVLFSLLTLFLSTLNEDYFDKVFAKDHELYTKPVPRWVDFFYDLIICFLMVFYGWFVFSFLWLIVLYSTQKIMYEFKQAKIRTETFK